MHDMAFTSGGTVGGKIGCAVAAIIGVPLMIMLLVASAFVPGHAGPMKLLLVPILMMITIAIVLRVIVSYLVLRFGKRS